MDESTRGDQPEPADAKEGGPAHKADQPPREPAADAIPTVAPHPARSPAQSDSSPEARAADADPEKQSEQRATSEQAAPDEPARTPELTASAAEAADTESEQTQTDEPGSESEQAQAVERSFAELAEPAEFRATPDPSDVEPVADASGDMHEPSPREVERADGIEPDEASAVEPVPDSAAEPDPEGLSASPEDVPEMVGGREASHLEPTGEISDEPPQPSSPPDETVEGLQVDAVHAHEEVPGDTLPPAPELTPPPPVEMVAGQQQDNGDVSPQTASGEPHSHPVHEPHTSEPAEPEDPEPLDHEPPPVEAEAELHVPQEDETARFEDETPQSERETPHPVTADDWGPPSREASRSTDRPHASAALGAYEDVRIEDTPPAAHEAEPDHAQEPDAQATPISEEQIWSSPEAHEPSSAWSASPQMDRRRERPRDAVPRTDGASPTERHTPPAALVGVGQASVVSSPAQRLRLPAWPAVSLPSPETRSEARSYLFLAARVLTRAALVLAATVLLLIVLYRWVDPPTSTLMLGQRLLGTEIKQKWVPLRRISSHLVHAVVLSEDGGFCRHRGVDWSALEEAIGDSRGGSTITMQVVKNLFLWPARSYVRKALEIMLAYVVEIAWPKHRIIEIYLNIAEWGPGVFGAEAAARRHFGRPASQLNAQEAALLAVSLPNPIERQAGSPGWQTRRLANNLLIRMRAVRAPFRCVRPRRNGS